MAGIITRSIVCTAISNLHRKNREKAFRVLLDVIELRKGEDSYGD